MAYSDIFDYPLTTSEIHRYLTGIEASVGEVERTLGYGGPFVRTGDFFTLPGREEIVSIRLQREARSRELLPTARRYGHILGALPFVRMVALTGSLAVMNISQNADFDYMLVAAHRHVWTARAFALLFNRLVKRLGHVLCPNLIISERALEWPIHDLYSARELYQMIPITGIDMYRKLLKANEWTKKFLPNASVESNTLSLEILPKRAPTLQRLMELFLRGRLGERFEAWEMNRKTARFSKQQGFGAETIFTADVCQGNFHHHSKWTREALETKLLALAILPTYATKMPSLEMTSGAKRG
jgi:hypothetical protein